ncbi:Protocatechuate 3,4-dioxygenase, beta subunit [Sulfitobacter noctilucae]|uniref:protocatechuate 3,4-dioxygenase subunit beta n=1 Tax=Sulfitobacter noctilucae TaxID=1342302 RepID=UPI00046967FC|nr:protocatechuate 3,4-dioxygenase subunit beta [Sulfitobacter noctilucae]KIN60547.1 Protocatechuate 3,4-dioxygenase, beta subunit [Sulfitobacter noctilucae]
MADHIIAPRDLDWHPKPLAPDYRSSLLRSPNHTRLHYDPTVTEMTGPTFGHGMLGPDDDDLIVNYAQAGEAAIGPRIIVHGKLLDEDGRPVSGKLIEVWQANAGGRYRHKKDGYAAPLDPNFGGCGRCISGEDGSYSFRTIQPGPYPWPNGGNDWRPAHIHFSVFGDGFAQRLITQMYFEGDPHIALCPIVQCIPSDTAIDRLVARLDMDNTVPMDIRAYRFDIVLRGRGATIFENQMEGT